MTSSTCQKQCLKKIHHRIPFSFLFVKCWCFPRPFLLKTPPDISLQISIQNALLSLFCHFFFFLKRRIENLREKFQDRWFFSGRKTGRCLQSWALPEGNMSQCAGSGLCRTPNLKASVASEGQDRDIVLWAFVKRILSNQ